MNIVHKAIQIKNQPVAVFPYDIRQPTFVPLVTETAVATCTVVHRLSPFRRQLSPSLLTQQNIPKPHIKM